MDCIFSGVEDLLYLPADRDGACWPFALPLQRLTFHRHQELELNLVTQGKAEYLLDDRRYSLQSGSLVWLFPAQHHVLLDRTPDFAMWILVVKPDLVARLSAGGSYAELREANPADPSCRRLGREAQQRLAALLADVAALNEAAHFNSGLAYALLSAWAAYQSATGEERFVQVHPAVEATARLLREGAEPTSLKQLTAQFGLSASRLSALFKEQTGTPLARYRNQQRIERVLRRYETPGARRVSLLEAALDAGFGSYAQFYRVFCETMGRPPAAYFEQNAFEQADSSKTDREQSREANAVEADRAQTGP